MYITNAILGIVAHSKCSIPIPEARLTILDRLVVDQIGKMAGWNFIVISQLDLSVSKVNYSQP